MPQGRGGAKPSPPERSATRRMVLEKVRVVVLPSEPEQAGAVLKAVSGVLGHAEPEAEAWVERGAQEGDKAKQAIDAFVKPGSLEQVTGEFRAVPLASWRGGVRYTQPSLVPVKAEQLD